MMTETTPRACGLALLAILAFALPSCRPAPAPAPAPPQGGHVTVRIAQQEGFPRSVVISISNSSDTPFCVAASEIDNGYENLVISQNRHRIYSDENSNRAIRLYRSINALDPIHIVLRGNTDFWYELNDFPLQRGRFSVQARIRMTSCSELFGPGEPRWFTVSGTGAFDYNPDNV